MRALSVEEVKAAKLVWIKYIQREIVPELEDSAAKRISKKRQKTGVAKEEKKCIQDERRERVQQHRKTIGPTMAFNGMCLYLPDKGQVQSTCGLRKIAECAVEAWRLGAKINVLFCTNYVIISVTPRSSNYKILIYKFQIEAGQTSTSKAAEKRIPADGSYNILTPNDLLLGRAKGNPAADSGIVDNSSKNQRAQLIQEVTDHFWQQWASEVTPVRVIRQQWHETK